MILWPGLAWGHPLEASLYGHGTKIRIDADTVRVDYEIEVPVRDLVREMRSAPPGEPFGAAKLQELRHGLVLKVDGAVVPTTDVPVPQAGANSEFVAYDLAFTAELAPGARTIRLSNGNAPDLPSVSMTTIEVGPGVSVTGSDVEDGVWRPDAPARESSVDVVIGGSILLDPGPPSRTLAEAAPPSLATAALGRTTTLWSIGIASLLALLAAIPTPGEGRWDRWGPLILVPAGLLPLPWVSWPVIAGIAAANALEPRLRPWASGAIGAALAGSVGWRAVPVVLASFVLGRLLSRPLGDHGPILLVAAPIWLVVRLLW